MKEIRTERLTIVPFELKYLNDYYNGFDKEITKYQYPDSFDSVEAAETLLQEFIEIGRASCRERVSNCV